MTAKEKAAQLRYKYSKLLDLKTTDKLILQCVLIAVDEILNNGFDFTDESEYWQEVKREIEKL